MAYIKLCDFCGQRISMREMRDGHWVAFDASTETAHKCGRETKPDPNITALGKKTKKEEPGGVDIGYNDTIGGEKVDILDPNYVLNKNKAPWIDEQAKVPESLRQDYSSNSENKKDFSFKNHSHPEWLSVLIWVVIIVAIFYFNLN
ncbi:MAG: hypothetical protein H8E55_48285 [Pelagibacterales bacterium]|nr:hypothetical protein [Pelagibacterales bacterium]